MKKRWYKIDNYGKFYALTKNSTIPAVFRYSVTLKDEVDNNILQSALEKTINYFPGFNCRLKKGLFWYYLETDFQIPRVERENQEICAGIYKDSDSILFRVTYYKNRINFEVSHILSDGRGSIQFMKYLIGNYLIEFYHLDETKIDINYDSTDLDKVEDSFDKFYTKPEKEKRRKYKTFIYKGNKSKKIKYFEYHLPTNKVLDVAHQYGVSLTSLLLAIVIKAYRTKMKIRDKDKSIKIAVPIDLRTYFKSSTTKNFFGLITIYYQSYEEESLKNIAETVQLQLKEESKIDKLKVRMNNTIRLEKNPIIKIIPIFIKDIIFKFVEFFCQFGSKICLSNIGLIKVDDQLSKYIENFNVLNSPEGFKLTICSFKNDLSIGVSTKYEDNDILKAMVDIFKELNITGMINTNLEEEDEM